MPSTDDLFKNSTINLENEIELIKSTPILEKVAQNLNLTTHIVGVGKIMQSRILDYPFDITKISPASITEEEIYRLDIDENNLIVTNIELNLKIVFKSSFSLVSTFFV